MSIIKLRVPEPMRSNQYWKVTVEAVEDYLSEQVYEVVKERVVPQMMDKESLLLESKSYGISELVKKLPVERGRVLLREFESMIKSKGSEWAVERIAQIYVGMDNLKIEYDYSNRSYRFINVGYEESQVLDEEMLLTLQNAMRYIAPAGKKVGTVSISAGDDFTYVEEFRATEAYEARGNNVLASHRISGITANIGSLFGFNIKPYDEYLDVQYRDESSLSLAQSKVVVRAEVLRYEQSMLDKLSKSETARLSDLYHIGDGGNSSTIAAVEIVEGGNINE